jgi:hypothetical protein
MIRPKAKAHKERLKANISKKEEKDKHQSFKDQVFAKSMIKIRLSSSATPLIYKLSI